MNCTAQRTRRELAAVAIGGAAVAATVAATLAAGSGAAGAATTQTVAYGGNAYASHVTLGTIANVGKTAFTPLCTTHAGAKHVNKTAKVDLGPAGYIGAATSQVQSAHSGAKSSSIATTHTAYTSLLTGMIKVRAITSGATVTHYASSYGTKGSSNFVGLTVAGKSFPAAVPANSSYSLPGLGTLILNGQHAYDKGGTRTMITTALNLTLGSSNSAGLPAGHIVIGRSTASLRLTNRVPSGNAYATQISVASVAGSGRTAAVYVPCGGTGNVKNSNDVAKVTIPNGVANIGVTKSTVNTTDSAAKTVSHSQNRVAGVSLLNGMIKVHALTTQANAAFFDGKRTVSAAGTKLLGLVVQGKAMSAPKMGQHMSIPGLGTLSFGYARKTKTGIVVYGLRLVLGSAQSGVPAGAVITVGEAGAGVSS